MRAQEGRFRTEEWRPGNFYPVLMVAGVAGGIFLGSLLEIIFIGTLRSSNRAGGTGWLLLTLILLLWLFATPLVQYLLMRWLAQVRPRFSLRRPHPKVFLSWSTRGHRFGRGKFALICAVPFLMAWGVLPVCAALFPEGGGIGAVGGALGIAMGMSLYWLRYSVLALRRPRGSLVEDLEEAGGLRFYEPDSSAAGRNVR